MPDTVFVLKVSLTLITFTLHVALFGLLIASLALPSGIVTESIALVLESVQTLIFPIRLYYYFLHRAARHQNQHELVFFQSMWLLSIVQAVWISVHGQHMLDDFSGLPLPSAAVIAVITFSWLAWAFTCLLVWITVQEHEDDVLGTVEQSFARPTAKPMRQRPSGRISAKIIRVVHGTSPELWDHNSPYNHDYTVKPPLALTYNPRDRQRTQPPFKTTYNQWHDVKIY